MGFNGLGDQPVYTLPSGDTTSHIDWSPDSKQLIFDTYPTSQGCCSAQWTSFHELNADGSNGQEFMASISLFPQSWQATP